MNKFVILALVMAAVYGAAVTNEAAYQCISEVTVPDQLSFTFVYAVQCNQFHNGLVNDSTSQDPVNVSNWNRCKTSLKAVKGVKASELNGFIKAISNCTTKGAAQESAAAAVSNQVAESCIEGLAIPDELQFAFNYGVDCNKFHNGLVNAATADKPVTVQNWTTCKKSLSSHFKDSDAKSFYSEIDQCVSSGKASLNKVQANTVTNKVAEDCIESLTVPSSISFSFVYGVDCNRFHNGLVNQSTLNKPVNVSNWDSCKKSLADSASEKDVANFEAAIGQCITAGKASLNKLQASSAISNKVAGDCIESVTIPSEVTFAFNYGVDCNRFHNGLVNESTLDKPVNKSDWKVCRDILAEHFTDKEANNFFTAIDQCVTAGKTTQVESSVAAISNKVAEECIESVTIPSEVTFAFNYAVDCNKFHNGLVNESTSDKAVSQSEWKVCRDLLAEHFEDKEALEFFEDIDSCVENGKKVERQSVLRNFLNFIGF